jgi:hypothetical protein
VKWIYVKGDKLWWGSWVYIGVAKWNEVNTKVICECNSSCPTHCIAVLFVYNMRNFSLIIIFINYSINCSTDGLGAILQAERSEDRLPMRSLIFFSAPSPSATLWLRGLLSL